MERKNKQRITAGIGYDFGSAAGIGAVATLADAIICRSLFSLWPELAEAGLKLLAYAGVAFATVLVSSKSKVRNAIITTALCVGVMAGIYLRQRR